MLIPEAEKVAPPVGALTLSTDGSMRTELHAAMVLVLSGVAGKGRTVSLVVRQGRTHTRYSGLLDTMHQVGDTQFAVLDWGMSIDMTEVVAATIE